MPLHDPQLESGGRGEAESDFGPGRQRAQAEQIDFLNGMIILLFGLGLFFASASVLFSIGLDTEPEREAAALNADQRLADDILVNASGDHVVDRDCADAFFGLTEDEPCGISGEVFNTTVPEQDGEVHWLRHALGVEDELRVNVTVVDGVGVVTSPGGVGYALGPAPPPDQGIYESNRIVATEDGDYLTVLVRVW